MAGQCKCLKKSGERGRNRTFNLLIKSQLLCQLSYAPGGNLTGRIIFDCSISRTRGHREPANVAELAEPLGALLDFGRQSARTLAGHRTARRKRLRSHRRTPLDCSNHWSVFHSIGVGHRDKSLLRAQPVDQPLLSMAQHGMRQNGKVPEHPQKINPLKKGWHDVARPDGSLHLYHAV
jgi:hypothetical protein